MVKKTHHQSTHSLLGLASNLREYVAIIQALITAFVAIVAIVISIRTQPLVDSIHSLEFRVQAVEDEHSNIESILEKRDTEYRSDVNKIMEDLNIIKGEIRRIK